MHLDVSLTRYGSYELGCPQSYCVKVLHTPLTESPPFSSILPFHVLMLPLLHSFPNSAFTQTTGGPSLALLLTLCGEYTNGMPNANCIKGPVSLNHLVPSHFTSPSTAAHRSPQQPTHSALISLSISSSVLPVLQIY